ncbi:MAG: DUF1778 domain-containing protein [Candidatus Adiutrix sp.]|jgi:uncharacterized protein (DUF1778 family)|nr:DUF1778 domain-containing protein [Candidatus Adiutrix sp.]
MDQLKANQSTVRLDARIPAHIKENLAAAAALTGRSQTDFLIAAVNEAAQKVIAEHSLIRLCLDDQKVLAKSLLGADDDNSGDRFARLSQAMRDHEREVESR